MEHFVKIRTLSLLLLLNLVTTDTTDVNISVTCVTTQEEKPAEWLKVPHSNPSKLHSVSVQLSNGPSGSPTMNISWTINIDSSIHSIAGTWIDPYLGESDHFRYRCEYQPPFTSKQIDFVGLEKLHFHFTSTDLLVEPNGSYSVYVYNLPPPPLNAQNPSKSTVFLAPGCNDERMRVYSVCSNWGQDQSIPNNSESQSDYGNLDIASYHTEGEIKVTFKSHPSADKYTIRLRKGTYILAYTEVMTGGKTETVKVTEEYSGPCEDLKIWITPHYKYCEDACRAVWHDVSCKIDDSSAPVTEEPKKDETSLLLISTGCAVVVLFILICFLYFCKRSMHSGLFKHGLDTGSVESLGVLLVYPAVDSVFQHAVMTLAEFLQSQRGVKVVIDVWQRGSLAELGPLRWLNSQVDQADKVLIVLPPQHTDTQNVSTECTPSVAPGRTDCPVPASAHELFSLAMNLVAGCVHESQRYRKFWVVHIGKGLYRSIMPVQLRDCKALFLPKDLNKLHQKLFSRDKVSNSNLSCRFGSCHCNEVSKKVRQAILELDRRVLKDEMVHLIKVENKP